MSKNPEYSRLRSADNKKKECQRKHFEKRCLERVGELLPYKEIVRSIKNSELEFLGKQTNRLVWYLYHYKDNLYILVYDKLRHSLVTILFNDDEEYVRLMEDRNGKKESV